MEIIPPSFRNRSGRRQAVRWSRTDLRQTINLTTVASSPATERIRSSYDATGRIVRQALAGAAHFIAYA
ncbi:MAG: hypothetical protein R3F07_08755 [Opitutaceae bacterium]